MKISVIDKGSGIAAQFAQAIGAETSGRFINIPISKGSGYITGFSWGGDLRMMIRNYYLFEDVFVERTNELAEGQEDIVVLLSGIFPPLVHGQEQLLPERARIMICRHLVSTIMEMPSNTSFGSVTIAISRKYLHQLFGHINHPVVANVLEAKENFVVEMEVSSDIIATANQMLEPPLPESLEGLYYKLKCEELLCHTFGLLLKREEMPAVGVHVDDIKAIYAIKAHLQAHLNEPPHIAGLAKQAKMSEPKLRKLFKRIFGRGVFEFYQFLRMEMAVRLLKDKKLTVSEVGYQLGFTNLSHFSRVFARYHGMKPKQYSQS
ncbi:AraC family transcriptional regulator [Chitinophaga sp. OAE865]|uniref:helix-turn-helix transcriptional regulator n=1 Tax=Chitinophaga sp. OAE865 TaxID=2817898 RepID=UPI001AE1B964